MATLAELNAKIDDLQTAIDADQASDGAVVAAMQAEIDRLAALLGTAVTEADIQATIDRLETLKADVAGPNG